jgi:hypothetical protein
VPGFRRRAVGASQQLGCWSAAASISRYSLSSRRRTHRTLRGKVGDLLKALGADTSRGACRRVSVTSRLCRMSARPAGGGRQVLSSSGSARPGDGPIRPRLSVVQLLAAKNAMPVPSLDELIADTFESDQQLEEFLAFTYAERPGVTKWPRIRAVLDTDGASLLQKGTLTGPLATAIRPRSADQFVTFGWPRW